jgi:hypothetical protein
MKNMIILALVYSALYLWWYVSLSALKALSSCTWVCAVYLGSMIGVSSAVFLSTIPIINEYLVIYPPMYVKIYILIILFTFFFFSHYIRGVNPNIYDHEE